MGNDEELAKKTAKETTLRELAESEPIQPIPPKARTMGKMIPPSTKRKPPDVVGRADPFVVQSPHGTHPGAQVVRDAADAAAVRQLPQPRLEHVGDDELVLRRDGVPPRAGGPAGAGGLSVLPLP